MSTLLTVANFTLYLSATCFWLALGILLYSTYFQRVCVAFLTARFRSLEKQREVFAFEHIKAKAEMEV